MIRQGIRSLARYLRAPVSTSAEDFGQAIEEEISFHLAERTRDYLRSGMSEADARHAAIEQFGSPARIAAECHAAAIGGLAIWHRLHLVATAALVLAVGALWYGSRSETKTGTTSTSSLPPGIASMLDNDWTGDVTGQILNEQGQPIDGAHVMVVVKTWPDHSYFQRAYTVVSGADGRFRVENVHPVNESYAVQIAAVADNRVLKSSYQSRTAGTLEPIVLELPPSSGFDLQVETAEGATQAGIEVLPQGRIDASGTEHVVYFDSAQSLVRRTDSQGRVHLPYYKPGETANVLVRVPTGEWQSQEILVPETGHVATVRPALEN